MSALLRSAASCLSIALLAGLLPAQDKPKTIDALRKENADLRRQVKTLRAQLDAKKPDTQKKAERDRRIRNWLSLRSRRATTRLFFDDAYSTSLFELFGATQKLNGALEPRNARRVVDRIERILLDVRRALWKFKQAEKQRRNASAARTALKGELVFSFRRF